MTFAQALANINAVQAAMPTMPTFQVPEIFTSGISSDPTAGQDFGTMLAQGIDSLQGVQNKADTLAVQAATGDLQSIQDYTIAATEASTATQLAVALRNQAVSAFTQIMQLQA